VSVPAEITESLKPALLAVSQVVSQLAPLASLAEDTQTSLVTFAQVAHTIKPIDARTGQQLINAAARMRPARLAGATRNPSDGIEVKCTERSRVRGIGDQSRWPSDPP
jgi:hypothetical protein